MGERPSWLQSSLTIQQVLGPQCTCLRDESDGRRAHMRLSC